MGKRRKMDPGLKYLQNAGFQRISGKYGLQDYFTSTFGWQKAIEICEMLDSLEKGTMEFYEYKNSDPIISLALNRYYDTDIVRQACNWIAANKELFGDTILEVGCDCGIISCFLAQSFPYAKILSIDRSQNAIRNAELFANRMNVTNVTFKACDLREITGTFDTVFSMRTVHENYNKDYEGLDDFLIKDLPEQAEMYRDLLKSYCHELKERMTEDGVLISIERIGRDALLLGWMEALHDQDLSFDLNRYTEIKTKEVEEESVFRAFIAFRKGEQAGSPQEMFDLSNSKYLDYTAARYTDWDAKIVFENRKKSLVEGYLIDIPEMKMKSKIELWTHKYDETSIMAYQNSNGIVSLEFYDISQQDELLKSIHSFLDETLAKGGTVQKLQ